MLDYIQRDLDRGLLVTILIAGGRSERDFRETEAQAAAQWFDDALRKRGLKATVETSETGFGHLQKIAAGLRWVRNGTIRHPIVVHTDEVRASSTAAQVFWLRLWEVVRHGWFPRIAVRAHPRPDPHPNNQPNRQWRKALLTWLGIGILVELRRHPQL